MKPNDIFNIDKLMTESTQTVNEVNPHNYDSDEDYYNALNAPAKRRSAPSDYPYSQEDDDAYFRDIFRKKREAAKKAEQDGQQGVAEGFGAPASAGPKAQRVTIISGPDVGQSGWLGKMSPQDAQKYPGYVLVHLNHGGGSTMLPKSAVKIDQGVAEGEANAGVTLRSQIIKLYKRGLEDYDIAYDLDIDEKIVADIIDDYDRKQQQRHAKKQGVANSMPQGNYSDEAHPIRDDGNELPDYAAMYESKLVEFAGGMGAGSVATAPGVGKGSNVGSLFGGSYSPKNSPFKAKKPKKSGMIKR